MPALKSCVIVALYLGNNAMGDQGITALADGLACARGLQKLHLNDNEVSQKLCTLYVARRGWRCLHFKATTAVVPFRLIFRPKLIGHMTNAIVFTATSFSRSNAASHWQQHWGTTDDETLSASDFILF